MNGGKKASIPVHGWSGERAPIPAPPCIPKHGSKKNTKRWCGGKVGREHDLQRKTLAEVYGWDNTPQGRARIDADSKDGHTFWLRTKVLVCGKCGRHMGYEQDGRANAKRIGIG